MKNLFSKPNNTNDELYSDYDLDITQNSIDMNKQAIVTVEHNETQKGYTMAKKPTMTTLDEMVGDDDSSNPEESSLELIGNMLDIADDFGHAPAFNEVSGRHNTVGVNIKILPHGMNLPLPEYQSELASGFDVYAATDGPIFLNSIGASTMIPAGISIAVPAGFEAQVRPRSGLAAKHGITVTNAPGTIDADYRGEIKILLTNLTGRRFKIERGMRIAQVVICPVAQAKLTVVEEHDQTERGEGGFGSTGV